MCCGVGSILSVLFLQMCGSSSSNSQGAPAQMPQEQQQQVAQATMEDTSSTAPERLYQLLLDAAGVPGLGSCSHSDEDDPDAALADGSSSSDAIGALIVPLHAQVC
jgi:hypothetical protein